MRIKTIFWLTVLYSFLQVVPIQAATLNVPLEYSTIQAAIMASSSTDIILVDAGIYTENINFLGKAITIESVNGAINTTIDGNQNGSVVVFESGEGLNSILDGFTITNGNGTSLTEWGGSQTFGGGILCRNYSSPKIINCIITNNTAIRGGGGIACWESSPSISNCLIKDNTADYGGAGIRGDYSSLIISDSVISSNSSDDGGGFNFRYCASPSIIGCLIRNNTVLGEGGGISSSSSSLAITNCRIVKNTASSTYNGRGGGIRLGGTSSSIIINSTISQNTAKYKGGGVRCVDNTSPTIINSILWGNTSASGSQIYLEDGLTIDITYSDVQGGWSGEGNMDWNPLFVDAENNDFSLQKSPLLSPCRDAGNPDSAHNDINGTINDMGFTGGPGGKLENILPVANAGDNIIIASPEQPYVTLEGIVTDGNENEVLSYRWLEGATVLLDWEAVGSNGEAYLDLSLLSLLSIGDHTLTLEARDLALDIAVDNMVLTINNSPPSIAVTGGGVYELNTDIFLNGQVADYDGDTLSYSWHEGATTYCTGNINTIFGGEPVDLSTCGLIDGLALGNHIITLEVNDGTTSPVTADLEVTIIDTGVPTLSPVPNTSTLWPPNHQMIDIILEANADDNSGEVTLSASISCDDPGAIPGTDYTEPQINQSTGIITFQLRSERPGHGNGRIYIITVTATDSSNNSSTATVAIVSPHDRRRN